MTPWDFEQVAPGLVELFTDGSVPSGDNESQRALVPGCGGVSYTLYRIFFYQKSNSSIKYH